MEHVGVTAHERVLRLGLVGCGRLAERGYIPAARRATGVELVAVADVDRARCEKTAPETRIYRHAEALIAAGGVDMLVVATPTPAHLANARLGAKAGLPMLVEKPPGINAKEAAAIAALNPQPWIGFCRRFVPELAVLRGALPRDTHLDLTLEICYRRSSWQPYSMQDDALLDLGPHLIDLPRWLTATEPRVVRALSIEPTKAIFELELERGHARILCGTNSFYREGVEVRDVHGRKIARYTSGGLLSAAIARLRPRDDNFLVVSLARQLEEFACAIRGGESPNLATANDGLVVMTVIDAVRRSASEGGSWCPVELSSTVRRASKGS
jgi:myo-inositol 2-dehydrogenase/D-chiro-inositol 1-dehydrogenase